MLSGVHNCREDSHCSTASLENPKRSPGYATLKSVLRCMCQREGYGDFIYDSELVDAQIVLSFGGRTGETHLLHVAGTGRKRTLA